MKEISDVRTPMFLNQDVDYSMLKPDESPYILNMDMVEGKLGTITKTKGNELLWKTYPAGTNKVVGWCEDMENNAAIFAVYNSNGNHYIVRHNADGSFNDISASESFWNFQPDKVVSMSVLGTGDNAELLMTDGYNEPRLFNIYNFENSVYSAATTGNANLIKPPPIKKVILTNNPDTTITTNNIRGKLFQVCYRYVYDDNKKSRWGFYSDNIYCESDTLDDRFLGASLNNRIQFTFTIDYTNISGIDIAIRNCDEGAGVTGLWCLYDSVDVTGTTFDYQFYNDKTWISLDQTEFDQFFDDVPLKSNCGISIGEDRVVLGGNTKGFDQITPDVSLSQLSSVYEVDDVYSLEDEHTLSGSGGNYTFTFLTDLTSQRLMISASTHDIEYYYLISDYGKTDSEVASYFESRMGDSAYNITLSRTAEQIQITNNETYDIYVRYENFIESTHIVESFIEGVKKLGIIYYDYANRDSRVITSDDFSFKYSDVNGTLFNKIKYQINHTPPPQATHYQFAICGNSIKNYFELPIITQSYGLLTSDISTSGDYTIIDIQGAIDRITNDIQGASIKTFEYAAGDMIQIKFYIKTTHNQVKFTDNVNVAILYVDADGKATINKWDYLDIYDTIIDPTTLGLVCQVYHPAPTTNSDIDAYYGIGDILPITGGYHTATWDADFTGSAQNQTASLPAIGILNWGDCYWRAVELFKPNNDEQYLLLLLASRRYSFLYYSEYINKGFLNISDPKFKEQYKNTVVWGGLLSETGIVYNQLNKFDFENERGLSDKNGDISSLQESGYSLNVIQRNKVTVLPVGRTEVTYSDGTTAMVGINGVFGDNNPLVENVGCIFPEAVVLNNRYVYFPDIYAGEVYRKSPNGLEPISDYGMSSYFRTKFREMLTYGVGNIDMAGGWDPVSKCYRLTMTITGVSSETIAFHEPSNRWTTFYSSNPSMYLTIGETKFYSINGYLLYLNHSDTAYRCNLFGADYAAKVWVPSNQSPLDIKRFSTIEVNSNKIWNSEEVDGVHICEDGINYQDENYFTYKPEMTSILPAARFAYREGKFVASFLRDYTTTSSSFKATDVINGRQLRGRNMMVKLNSDSSSETDNILLYSVTINSSISR